MNDLKQKIFSKFLNLLRPFLLFWQKKSPQFWRELKENFKDPYLSSMVSSFNVWHEWIFKPYFSKVKYEKSDLENIKELSKSGTIVYISKNQGQLGYSFFNHLFLKNDIPLVVFANGIRTLFWRRFSQIFQALLVKLDIYFQKGFLPHPIKSGYISELIQKNFQVLINLKVSHELVYGVDQKVSDNLYPIIEAAKSSDKPVYVVTQLFLQDTHPEKESKESFLDLFFGEKSKPGRIRKLIIFFSSYFKRSNAQFGEPILVQDFLKLYENLSAKDIAIKLQEELLNRLDIQKKTITGSKLISKSEMRERLLSDVLFHQELEKIDQGYSEKKALKEAERYFDEIASEMNYNYIHAYDYLFRWVSENIYEGLNVDSQSIKQIKKVAGSSPVVLVPCHKSHVDYILLSYIFYNHELSVPHICAGNNLGFWPLGHFLRRGGAFFIRRKMKGKELYKLVLSTYLRLMIQEGYMLEFFIEGTRTRTGKLQKPKMGILSMILDAYFKADVEDIHFVPVSISYEKVLESDSYQGELKGRVKKGESLKSLAQIPKFLKKKYGKVFVNFSQPISFKNFLDDQHNDHHQNLLHPTLQEFAYHLTYHINRVATVTTTAMMSTVILSGGRRSVYEYEIFGKVKILEKYLNYKKVYLSGAINRNLSQAYEEALHHLEKDNLIKTKEDFEDKFIVVEPYRRLAIDIQKNGIIHFFVSLVCVCKSIQLMAKKEILIDDIMIQFETLRTILRHDFTFSARHSLEKHIIKVLRFLANENFLKLDEQKKIINLESEFYGNEIKIYQGLLDNYFESALMTIMFIKHVSFSQLPADEIERQIKERGQVLFDAGVVKYFESLSQFNIRNMLSVFCDIGLLEFKDLIYTRKFDNDTVNNWEKIISRILDVSSHREKFDLINEDQKRGRNMFQDKHSEVH